LPNLQPILIFQTIIELNIKIFQIFVILFLNLMYTNKSVTNISLINNATDFYNSVLTDIRNAKKSIYFEMYRITKEATGKAFRDALAMKASEGLDVVLLVDAWGTGSSVQFFKPIIANEGKVKIFNTFRIGTSLFTQSHRRNHRKIIVIDKQISYVGSCNISNYNTEWRELVLRMEGHIANPLQHVIETDFQHHLRYSYTQKKFSRSIHYHGFEIIRDIPSILKQKMMKKYLYLIKNATKSIYIETPYFLPGYRLRKALEEAASRGVEVIIVMPVFSDVRLVDILRNRYLGKLHESGISLLYYKHANLHSKLCIIDDDTFLVGSSNFDYRSFRYMHEIMILGKHEPIFEQLQQYKAETLSKTTPFEYELWLKRSYIEKFLATLLVPIRYLF